MQASQRLAAYYFCHFAFIGAFNPYFGLYLKSLEFSAWQVGLVMSQMQLMRIVTPWVWGPGRRSTRGELRVLRFAALASLVAFSGLLFWREFAAVLANMAVMAFFWSAALPAVEAITVRQLAHEPEQYGRIRLWGSVGFVIAVMAVGALLDRAPVSVAVWLPWLLVVAVWGTTCLLSPGEDAGVHSERTEVGRMLLRPQVSGLLLACFLMSIAHAAFYVFYAIYLVANGYSPFVVGGLFTLGVVAEIVAFWRMPSILARFSLRSVLLASFLCVALRFVLVGWRVQDVVLMVFAQLLHGMTFGAYHAAAMASLSRFFPGRAQVAGQAWYGAVSFGAGGLVGGLAAGATWDVIGPAWTYTWSAGAGLLGFCVLWLAWPSSPERSNSG
ncbi:MAG: hypothetical protein AMXMBFR6_19910 [Betaproteobacteria bacterium]